MKISILGNSKRTDYLKDKLLRDGNEVFLYKEASTLPEYINSELVVLPIPTLNKDGFINFKDSSKIEPEILFEKINKQAIIVACNFSLEDRDVVDINKREDFAYLNAIPTAEAAIVLAIENLKATIYKSNCLICGFGRIGKMLATKLKSLNAFVTVSARNPKDLAYIDALDLNSIKSSELEENLSHYDIVFQTVPCRILTEELLKKQKSRPILVELSSACAGTDMLSAEKLGFKAIDATNLPEKFMPNTAGSILYDVIMRILEEKSL